MPMRRGRRPSPAPGAVMHRQHHVADVLHGDQASHAAHVIELAALRIESAAALALLAVRALSTCCTDKPTAAILTGSSST